MSNENNQITDQIDQSAQFTQMNDTKNGIKQDSANSSDLIPGEIGELGEPVEFDQKKVKPTRHLPLIASSTVFGFLAGVVFANLSDVHFNMPNYKSYNLSDSQGNKGITSNDSLNSSAENPSIQNSSTQRITLSDPMENGLVQVEDKPNDDREDGLDNGFVEKTTTDSLNNQTQLSGIENHTENHSNANALIGNNDTVKEKPVNEINNKDNDLQSKEKLSASTNNPSISDTRTDNSNINNTSEELVEIRFSNKNQRNIETDSGVNMKEPTDMPDPDEMTKPALNTGINPNLSPDYLKSLSDVSPIVYNGIKYQQDQNHQLGGYLSAIDDKTGVVSWTAKIYESDKNGTYFTKLQVISNELLIENDRGEAFKVNIDNNTMIKIK